MNNEIFGGKYIHNISKSQIEAKKLNANNKFQKHEIKIMLSLMQSYMWNKKAEKK